MKRRTIFLGLMIAVSTLFISCKTKDEPNNIPGDLGAEVSFQAEVIQAEDSLLIAPDQDSNEYKSSDQITVHFTDSTITDQKGNEILAEQLKPGDRIEVTYNGMIAESYPAQISASGIKIIGHNLLLDGYMAIIDDIYQEDEGLNYGMKIMALDTTGWVGVTDVEKEMIFSELSNRYGAEIKDATYESLVQEGLIDDKVLSFGEGILITLSDMKYKDGDKKITCSVSKWKGGDGAIGADVTAKYKDDEWKITRENMWIS